MRIDKLEAGEIVLAKLTVKDSKNKIHTLENVIFSRSYEIERTVLKISSFEDLRLIKKFKLNEDLSIVGLEIIKKTGYKSKTNKYHEAKRNNEQRNKITGAYE